MLIFRDRPISSATSTESSRRPLLNDMAEHRSILKNNQITYYPRYIFKPKKRRELPKHGVSFLLCNPLTKIHFFFNIKLSYMSPILMPTFIRHQQPASAIYRAFDETFPKISPHLRPNYTVNPFIFIPRIYKQVPLMGTYF